jgi:pimeloyl-ACP methyl ester carboxylesterase
MTTTEGGLPQGELGVDAGIAESDVNFYSDGYLLRGVLVLPSGDGAHSPRPAVIYTHGWSGAVNDRALPLLRLLAARGYVGIAIDHRGFAGSDGPTRARCDPREQARDVANTVTYLSTRGDVASDRIAVIGASFGGAIAVAAGALDRRLVGVVSMVGIGDGGRWLQSLHGDQWSRVQERLAADAVLRSRTGVGERVPFTQLMPSNAHSAIHSRTSSWQPTFGRRTTSAESPHARCASSASTTTRWCRSRNPWHCMQLLTSPSSSYGSLSAITAVRSGRWSSSRRR